MAQCGVRHNQEHPRWATRSSPRLTASAARLRRPVPRTRRRGPATDRRSASSVAPPRATRRTPASGRTRAADTTTGARMQLDIYRRPEPEHKLSFMAVPAGKPIPQEVDNVDWKLVATATEMDVEAPSHAELPRRGGRHRYHGGHAVHRGRPRPVRVHRQGR